MPKGTQRQCLPDSLVGTEYYQPTEEGVEARIKARLEQIKAWKAELAKKRGGRRPQDDKRLLINYDTLVTRSARVVRDRSSSMAFWALSKQGSSTVCIFFPIGHFPFGLGWKLNTSSSSD